MADIEIGQEVEGANHWTYDVSVYDGGQRHRYDVTLSWSDYDHWSGGRVPPAEVVEAAFRFLLEREPATEILAKFDCSVIRRYFAEVDQVLPGLL